MRLQFGVFSIGRRIRQVVYIIMANSILLSKLPFFIGFFLYLNGYYGFSRSASLCGVLSLYLVTGGWRFAWVIKKTFFRDLRGLKTLMVMRWTVYNYIKKKHTVPKMFQDTAKKFPDKPCFLFEDKKWTFKEVDDYSNAIGNYFHEAGYREGDVIALFMESRPEYICMWLGLSKIGVVAALINFNLKDVSLTHCINISHSKAVIFGAELSSALKDILPNLSSKTLKLYCSGAPPVSDFPSTFLDPLLDKSPAYSTPACNAGFKDRLFYVFTSGTTGMPKAAIVSHFKFYFMSYGVNAMLKVTSDDIVYDMLPLYHTAGGVVGMGQTVLSGTTLVIRKKFSASAFWDDCVKYNCTIAQYIGEICRYLLAQPVRPSENQHRVRLMFGNGLRPQIWAAFQKRFGVKQMGEFYGATEGNANLINSENKIGAVGFTTRIAPFLYPVTLIKFNKESGEPLRDRNGVCIKAEPGEPGELVGKIVKGDAIREFDGYVNKDETDKKIARDVFIKGDMAFMTGDVLVMDECGFMYFRDRTGDTFRWRGENVSTSEVEAVISNIIKLKDAVVYGVEIPGTEGRAGMVAIVDENDNIDLSAMNSAMQKALPPYARPIFVRLTKAVESTTTFKLKKTELRKEAFDPNAVKDKIFYLNSKAGQYEILTPEIYSDISSGKIRM